MSRRHQLVVSDDVDLEDMEEEVGEVGDHTAAEVKVDGVRYFYPCRCGDYYEVMCGDLHPDFGNIIIPCRSCSLNVRVHYKMSTSDFSGGNDA